MENIIKNCEDTALSGKDILKLTENKTKLFRYSDLKNIRHIDEILYPNNCAVILYEIKPEIGHWTCIIKKGNNIEFFCPYGIFVDDHLKHCYKHFPNYLSRLIYNSNYGFINNHKRLQKMINSVSTCGRHVAFRIIMKDLNLKQYLKLFKDSKLDPDLQLCYLTAFLK
ncbi:MAG TPA: hypothetical protein VN703_00235 [Candidatus Sulfopaludibacter sp.]|nr:hypothetical protein [Candidatus Sulfopaludibacter sp.]